MGWTLFRRGSKQTESVITRTPGREVTLPSVGPVPVLVQVNCVGASCPRPQILALKAYDEWLEDGDVMELVSDNPSSVESLSALALVLDAYHLGTVRGDHVWRVYLGKGFDHYSRLDQPANCSEFMQKEG